MRAGDGALMSCELCQKPPGNATMYGVCLSCIRALIDAEVDRRASQGTKMIAPEQLLFEARFFRYAITDRSSGRWTQFMESLLAFLEREAEAAKRDCRVDEHTKEHPAGCGSFPCMICYRTLESKADLTPRQQTLAIMTMIRWTLAPGATSDSAVKDSEFILREVLRSGP